METYIDNHLRLILLFSGRVYYFHGFAEPLPFYEEAIALIAILGDSYHGENEYTIRATFRSHIGSILSAASNIATAKKDLIGLSRIQGMIYTLVLCSDEGLWRAITRVNMPVPITLARVIKQYPDIASIMTFYGDVKI